MFATSDIKVILGAHNLSIPVETGKESFDVKSIHIHKDWNILSEDYDADIAILDLDREVSFSNFIQPICLFELEQEILDISRGYSVGFGLDENGKIQSVLKYTETPIENDNFKCVKSKLEIGKLMKFRSFCAGDREISGVCSGDSGSGLFVKHRGIYYIRGIVSVSLQNNEYCDIDNYAVFTNVPSFFDWIREKNYQSNSSQSNR